MPCKKNPKPESLATTGKRPGDPSTSRPRRQCLTQNVTPQVENLDDNDADESLNDSLTTKRVSKRKKEPPKVSKETSQLMRQMSRKISLPKAGAENPEDVEDEDVVPTKISKKVQKKQGLDDRKEQILKPAERKSVTKGPSRSNVSKSEKKNPEASTSRQIYDHSSVEILEEVFMKKKEGGKSDSKSKKKPLIETTPKNDDSKGKVTTMPPTSVENMKSVEKSPLKNKADNNNAVFSRRSNVNILNALYSFSSKISNYELERRSRAAVAEQVSQFRVFKSVTPFDRRVTALAWHPKEPTLCAVGSKGGDLLLWNYVNDEFQSLLTGIGPGGSVQCLEFDTNNSNRIYSCSIDGTFAAKDFGGKQDNVFLNTENWNKWYTSFDVSNTGGTLMVGDNNGNVTLMTKEGEEVWNARLHKSKVTNIQFSPREPWLVITTSVDNTVKVWDIRVLSSDSSTTVHVSPKGGEDRKNRWLQSLDHEKPVNAAYFSQVDGTRLLTTDQHSQLRVYRAPFWNLERTIPHPHRQFQHLTPIRATWHPLIDMAVVGRYPDEKFSDFVPGELRTIDCIDADSGRNLVQLHEPGINKISSLNQFSGSGDALLSGMGQTILVWKQKPEDAEVHAYQEKISNLKNLMVEEWPGYKPLTKSVKSKKLK